MIFEMLMYHCESMVDHQIHRNNEDPNNDNHVEVHEWIHRHSMDLSIDQPEEIWIETIRSTIIARQNNERVVWWWNKIMIQWMFHILIDRTMIRIKYFTIGRKKIIGETDKTITFNIHMFLILYLTIDSQMSETFRFSRRFEFFDDFETFAWRHFGHLLGAEKE